MPKKFLNQKRVLITAGPTREYIDPVRYISNDSSGKMGYALAEAALKAGANVTLISGPCAITPPKVKKFVPVISAREMRAAVMKEFKKADIIICAAAVSDFRPTQISKNKIKKRGARCAMRSAIKLRETPDILKSICKMKRKDQVVVGFALETNNLIENARKKLQEKNCDFIIANHARSIASDKTTIHILSRNGKKISYTNLSKKILALNILRVVACSIYSFTL